MEGEEPGGAGLWGGGMGGGGAATGPERAMEHRALEGPTQSATEPTATSWIVNLAKVSRLCCLSIARVGQLLRCSEFTVRLVLSRLPSVRCPSCPTL